MAALPPSADVFQQERRRLEEAAADLRSLLAQKNEQLSEQCAKCAHEEEKLLCSKFQSEFKEISSQKDALKAKLQKNSTDLEHQEMDLKLAEERKKTVEEYQIHLTLTEQGRTGLLARIDHLKAKQRGATDSLKSRVRQALETQRKEEARLSQELHVREEDLARNEEVCATRTFPDAEGMTLQEHLAADLKHQLSASQEKIATLEASVESMQAESLQKELRVEEMIQSCDLELKQKASQRDVAEKESLQLQERQQSVEAGFLEIKRLNEADSVAKDLHEKLLTSGLAISDMRAAVCQDKAPEEEWNAEKRKLQVQVAAGRKRKDKMEVEVKKLEEEVRLQRSDLSDPPRIAADEVSNALSEHEMQAKELRSRILQLQSNPNIAGVGKDLGQLQLALDAKTRRLRMLSSLIQEDA